jgi:hypothetical protein
MTAPEVPVAGERSSKRSRWLTIAALTLLAVGPLLPTLRSTFVFDDTQIIGGNETIHGWGSLLHVWAQPYWPNGAAIGLYRPFQIALISVLYNAGGGKPIWFHVYALLLVAFTSMAVWWLIRRGAGRGPALVAALWFAVHPLHVEPVASVANSSELLVVLCTIAIVAVLLRWPAEPARPARDWYRALLVGVIATAAILSKESGIIALPLAALSVWGWDRRSVQPVPTRDFIRTNVRVWIAGAICVGTALVARAIVLAAAVTSFSLAPAGLEGLTAVERVRSVISLWPRIAQMILLPADLSPLYGTAILPDHRGAIALASIAVVAALVAAAIVEARRGDRRLFVAFAWMGAAYLPASNLLAAVGPLVSDRTLFGVTVGAALALAWALDRMPPFSRRVATVLLALLMVRAAVVTTRYALDWTNHRMLWTRLTTLYPDEHVGHHMLGLSLWAHGDTSRALVEVGRGLAMSPSDQNNRDSYARLLYETGHYERSVQVMAPLMSIERWREDPMVVAYYFDAIGRASGAAAVIKAAKAFLHGKSTPVAELYIGLAQERLGNRGAADSAYRQGLRVSPRDSMLNVQLKRLHAGHEPAARVP